MLEAQRSSAGQSAIVVALDLQAIDRTQQVWMNAELKRRRALAPRLALEFEFAEAERHPGVPRAFETLRAYGVRIILEAGQLPLTDIDRALGIPADLLRVPFARVAGVARGRLLELTAGWRASGLDVIVDGVDRIGDLSALWEMDAGYAQGEAIAAPGPRLDFEFQREG